MAAARRHFVTDQRERTRDLDGNRSGSSITLPGADRTASATVLVVDVSENGSKNANQLAPVVAGAPASQRGSEAFAYVVQPCAFRITGAPYCTPLALTHSMHERRIVVRILARPHSLARRHTRLHVFESCSAH